MADRKKAPARRAKGGYRPLKGDKKPAAAAAPPAGEEEDKAAEPPVREPGNPAGIGDNKPPPDVLHAEHVDGLFMEAENWLDGEPISNEEQAEAVTKLKGLLRQAIDGAEAARKAEKEPFLEGGRAVDAKWKPIKEKAEKALKVAQRALTPWLQAVEAENERKAREARAAAEEAAERLRQQAIAARESSDLRDEDVRETLEREAKVAERAAREAEKAPAVVRTEAGGSSLRTIWLVNVTDYGALLKHYKETRPEEVKTWLREQAQKDVRAKARSLPGCSIWSEKRAI